VAATTSAKGSPTPAKSRAKPPVPGQGRQPRTIKCITYPNRTAKRIWIPRAVARVYCKCLEEGSTEPEIQKEIRERCGARVEKKQPVQPDERDAALALADREISNTVNLTAKAISDYDIMDKVIQVLIELGLLVLVGRFLRGGLTSLRNALRARAVQMEAQQKANIATLLVIRRAQAAARQREAALQ